MDVFQEDDNALLQAALAMSMDDSSSNITPRDTDMSEAASEDPELALGKLVHRLSCVFVLDFFFKKITGFIHLRG